MDISEKLEVLAIILGNIDLFVLDLIVKLGNYFGKGNVVILVVLHDDLEVVD